MSLSKPRSILALLDFTFASLVEVCYTCASVCIDPLMEKKKLSSRRNSTKHSTTTSNPSLE